VEIKLDIAALNPLMTFLINYM